MTDPMTSSQAEAVRVLAESELFAVLGPQLVERVVRQASWQTLPAGAELVRQGEAGDSAYLVLDGSLDIVVAIGGEPVRLASIYSPHIVGEIAVFGNQPRTATVVAREDTRLLRLEQAQILDIVRENPEIGIIIIGELGRRLAMVNQPLAFLTLAAEALDNGTVDVERLVAMAEQSGELGPFARTFRGMVQQIEAQQVHRREMAVAARIQTSLLPRPLNGAGRPFAIQAFIRPTRAVGGDFYDHFLIDDRHLAVVVADVSGKGVPASLFMAMFRMALKSVALPGRSPASILAHANTILAADNRANMFVTVFLGVLDLDSGRFVWASAGHNPPYLLGADGRRQDLASTGTVLGIIAKAIYTEEQCNLVPGDLLFLFTDGVTEAYSARQELFGEARLEALLEESRGLTPAEIVARVIAAVDAFAAGAEQSDDITCLALAYRPGP